MASIGFQHEALAARQVIGQAVRVGLDLEGVVVTAHAQETDLGGGQQPSHALEHAQAGAQDRHNDWTRLGERESDGRSDGGLDWGLGHSDLAGRLVGEQSDQLINELTKRRRWRITIAQDGKFVGDQGVISYVEAHGYRLHRPCGHAHPGA